MNTTRRFDARRGELQKIFEVNNVVKIWRSVVRDQMRSLELIDLHDYYDVTLNIFSRSQILCDEILNGRYRPSLPAIYKIEKKLGICRHLMTPTPTDALVIQVITQAIADELLKASPTANAYFSRGRHSLKLPHEIREQWDYNWISLWRRFQKTVFNFTKCKKYLVVTDIANYFDNIGLKELRVVISEKSRIPEVYLDLLFTTLESQSWSPDYIPRSFRGLPTINIEAPRLLAHVFLYEIDEIAHAMSGGCCVRWMDDINIGVDGVSEGSKILGSLNDVLKSRGLALNIGKTVLYKDTEAQNHFMFSENVYLDNIQEKINNGTITSREKTYLLKRVIGQVTSEKKQKNWGKIAKRYFTTLSLLKSDRLISFCVKMYASSPDLRNSIAQYLIQLGNNHTTRRCIEELLRAERFDDIAKYNLYSVVTSWNVGMQKEDKLFILRIKRSLLGPKTQFDCLSYLQFLAKYGSPSEVINGVLTTKNIWKANPFLGRQAMAILPRAYVVNKSAVTRILNDQIANGTDQTASVAKSIIDLLNLSKLSQEMRGYIDPPKLRRYGIGRYLVMYAMACSGSIKADAALSGSIRAKMIDAYYSKWLQDYTLL
jgi:hypothetical protein